MNEYESNDELVPIDATGPGQSQATAEPDGGIANPAQSAATQGALPLDVRTGDARVDDAVAQLHVLDGLPVAEHVAVFGHVHGQLQDALSDLGRD